MFITSAIIKQSYADLEVHKNMLLFYFLCLLFLKISQRVL